MELGCRAITQSRDAGGDSVEVLRLVETDKHADEQVEEVGVVRVATAEIFEFKLAADNALRIGAEQVGLLRYHFIQALDLITDILAEGEAADAHQFGDLVGDDGVVAGVSLEFSQDVQHLLPLYFRVVLHQEALHEL